MRQFKYTTDHYLVVMSHQVDLLNTKNPILSKSYSFNFEFLPFSKRVSGHPLMTIPTSVISPENLFTRKVREYAGDMVTVY